MINIQDYFQNRVDLLIGIRRMPKEVFQRVQSAQFMDTAIKIAGPEDFIALKLFAGGPKDIQDILGVIKISKNKINLASLKKITLCYGSKYLNQLESLLKES